MQPTRHYVKKHKLGIVLFALGNIDPKFRSTLRVIHLVVAVTGPVLETHGLDAILEPFLGDLRTLATDGIVVSVNGTERTFKGALLAVLADNLASHGLGGFKESFSFAIRICRTCMITKDDFRLCFSSNDCNHRSDSQHEEHCRLVCGPLQSHYSAAYGVNRRSALMDVPYFSLFGGSLPHDFMHDVLEGVALHETSLLLHYCISEAKYFTLSEYNESLTKLYYEYTESDKPAPITRNTFASDAKLRLTASQSLLLVRILPLLVGGKVPESDPRWQCFLIQRKVIDLLACPVSSVDQTGSLKVLICDHHEEFVRLYSEEAMIPKFHYLIHYPDQIYYVKLVLCKEHGQCAMKPNLTCLRERPGLVPSKTSH